MSKYTPLKHYLARHATREAPLTFSEVENILGFSLPRSARTHAPWWANETSGGHVQARAWMDAGWRTSRVDIPAQKVTFIRAEGGVDEAGAPFRGADQSVIKLPPLSAAAAKLLADYMREAGGDAGAAVARALHEAAIARRTRLIDSIPLSGAKSTVDSVDLIREDRDDQ